MPVKKPRIETNDIYVLAILAVALLIGEFHAVGGVLVLVVAIGVAFYI
jgi:hypothetical protein